MTVAVDLKLYFCRPCAMHDRVSLRYAIEQPTQPCQHSGDGQGQCKRIEWVERNFYCVICKRQGKTSIHYGTDVNTAECRNGHRPGLELGAIWAETDESKWVFRNIPPLMREPS